MQIGLWVVLGNGVAQSFEDPGDHSRLDQYGRVIDLEFAGAGHGYQYGYDLAGDRSYAHVMQAMLNGVSHENDRSHRYFYDLLGRLTGAGRTRSSCRSLVCP